MQSHEIFFLSTNARFEENRLMDSTAQRSKHQPKIICCFHFIFQVELSEPASLDSQTSGCFSCPQRPLLPMRLQQGYKTIRLGQLHSRSLKAVSTSPPPSKTVASNASPAGLQNHSSWPNTFAFLEGGFNFPSPLLGLSTISCSAVSFCDSPTGLSSSGFAPPGNHGIDFNFVMSS